MKLAKKKVWSSFQVVETRFVSHSSRIGTSRIQNLTFFNRINVESAQGLWLWYKIMPEKYLLRYKERWNKSILLLFNVQNKTVHSMTYTTIKYIHTQANTHTNTTRCSISAIKLYILLSIVRFSLNSHSKTIYRILTEENEVLL